MKRLLLIKLTSLGDVIHILPSVSDAMKAHPDLVIDWVIDVSLQEVASWHPAIHRIFPTKHRVWRKHLFELQTFRSIKDVFHQIRETEYDLILDGQGNFKTALLSLCAKGARAGFDRKSVREWVAHLAYQQRHNVSQNVHAIDRLRKLFAASLHYPLPTTKLDYGIDTTRFVKPALHLPNGYLVFIANASWQTKLWPEAHWQKLIQLCEKYPILLPWGNEEEKNRAERLAVSSNATVLPKLTLSEMGYVLQQAKACVSLDTGLIHLASALNIPSVALYGPTDPDLIGAVGDAQILRSKRPCSPCKKKLCPFHEKEAPCLKEIAPETAYGSLIKLIDCAKPASDTCSM